jgi:hypothetical protein
MDNRRSPGAVTGASVLALLVLLGLTAGCDRGAPAGDPPVAPLHVPSDSGVDAFFARGPMVLGPSRAELTAQLGEPDSVAVRTVENRHDPAATDSIVTFYYDGLTAEIHVAGYDGKEILSALVIGNSRYLQAGTPVQLGDSEASVRAALGDPDEAGESHLDYMCDDCLAAGQETTRFVLDRGVVTRIEVRYWVE